MLLTAPWQGSEGDGLDHQEDMKHFSLGMMTVFKSQMEGVVAA